MRNRVVRRGWIERRRGEREEESGKKKGCKERTRKQSGKERVEGKEE